MLLIVMFGIQITPDGFKSLSAGCTMLQILVLNEFPTLNDDCMIVSTFCQIHLK